MTRFVVVKVHKSWDDFFTYFQEQVGISTFHVVLFWMKRFREPASPCRDLRNPCHRMPLKWNSNMPSQINNMLTLSSRRIVCIPVTNHDETFRVEKITFLFAVLVRFPVCCSTVLLLSIFLCHGLINGRRVRNGSLHSQRRVVLFTRLAPTLLPLLTLTCRWPDTDTQCCISFLITSFIFILHPCC